MYVAFLSLLFMSSVNNIIQPQEAERLKRKKHSESASYSRHKTEALCDQHTPVICWGKIAPSAQELSVLLDPAASGNMWEDIAVFVNAWLLCCSHGFV